MEGMRDRLKLEPVDIRRTWQVLIGAVLVAAGPVVIILGYTGAARTPYIEEQIPYLISGGLLGLGLALLGGFLFWGHWLYRLYERQEYHQQRLLDAIERLTGDPLPAAAAPGALVMTATGSVVHDPSCAVVASSKRATRPVTPAEARQRGYRACGICEPDLWTT